MDHVMKVLSAAEQGDVPAMNSFLEQGLGGVCDEEGASPLMYAAANGKDSVLRVLLQNSADVNGCNLYGWTPLLQAACYGHLPCVMLLLQSGADVMATNKWGISALVGAAQGGFPTIVQVLLREGAEVNRSSEVTCLTALMAATQSGHEDIVAQLIESGAEVNARLRTTRWTALMLATLNNHLPVVKLLLKHGASKEARDINGKTAGDLATALGHKSIASLLSGEKPKLFTEADLFVAVKAGNLEQVNEILDQDRGLACVQDKDGATPLMFAANKGHTEICEVLLSTGVDVNVQDSVNGWTALMQATHQKKHQVAKLLGARGADVGIRGKSGSTAFDIANMIGDIEMIRIIANATMERIQNRSPGTTTNDPAPSSQATPFIPSTGVVKPKSIEETDAPLAEERGEATQPEAIKEEAPAMIDMSELTRRMQNAHKSPTTPVLSIPESERLSLNSDPSSSRFPRNRIRSNPRLSSSPTSSLGAPELGSSGSSSASEPLPPASFRVGNTPMPKNPRGDKCLLRPVSREGPLAKFLSKSGPPGGRETAGSKPSSLPLKPANKNPLISPQNSSRFAAPSRELPSLLQKYAGSPSRGDPRPRLPILTTSKVKERGLVSPYRRSSQTGLCGEASSPGYVPGKMRARSSTDPARSRPFVGWGSKKPLLKTIEQSAGQDLQTILEGESLGHCHTLFAAQEVDYDSFVTLTASDLEELGFTSSEERSRLLRLIARLSSRTPGAKTPGSSSSTPRELDTPHRSQTYPVFVFQ